MKTVCCVCKTVTKDGPELTPSHGYCNACMRSEMAANGVPEVDINAAVMDLNLKRWGCIWK